MEFPIGDTFSFNGSAEPFGMDWEAFPQGHTFDIDPTREESVPMGDSFQLDEEGEFFVFPEPYIQWSPTISVPLQQVQGLTSSSGGCPTTSSSGDCPTPESVPMGSLFSLEDETAVAVPMEDLFSLDGDNGETPPIQHPMSISPDPIGQLSDHTVRDDRNSRNQSMLDIGE